MALPRNLIETDWFQTVATINPVTYLMEAFRSCSSAAGRRGAGARLRRRGGDRGARHVGGDERPALADGAHVNPPRARRLRARSRLGGRLAQLHNFLTKPSLLLPALIFPLFFFASFAGGLSAVGNVPDFDYPTGYTAFQYVFVLMQSAAFGGVFTGFGIARDFETGFARRLLLAAPDRRGDHRRLRARRARSGAAHLGRRHRRRPRHRHADRAAASAISSACTRSRCCSTSPRPCGLRAWRCGSARSRAAR